MDAPDQRVILVFVRAPLLGRVKTRLAITLDEQIVLGLYRCFILDLLEMLDGLGWPVILCHTPADAGSVFRRWLPRRYDMMPQEGSHLGLRMAAAFQTVFSDGFRKAILVGSDSPDLPGRYIRNAFSDLRSADAVIGPATDGGYYLIGFRKETFCPALFDAVAWGTPRVLDETLAIAKANRLCIKLQPRWTDIDDVADLKGFIRRNASDRSVAPRTLAFLEVANLNNEFK